MRFNLVVNLERMTPDVDMRDVARHLTEMVQMADEGGFDIVWAAEHHALAFDVKPTNSSAPASSIMPRVLCLFIIFSLC